MNSLKVSYETYETLKKYQSLLLKWNKYINLISKSSENELWKRHIDDSLQLLKYIDPKEKVIDIGSGAGFPGIVLSIGGIENVTLVESNKRKAVFLKQASKLSTNKVNIIAERLDAKFQGIYNVLTCRGFSKLSDILLFTKSLKIDKMLLLKGKNYDNEISEAKENWLFDFIVHDSVTGSGKIIEITK